MNGRQAYGRTDRHTYTQTEKQTKDSLKKLHTETKTDGQTSRGQTDRQSYGRTNEKTERWTEKTEIGQTERKTDKGQTQGLAHREIEKGRHTE